MMSPAQILCLHFTLILVVASFSNYVRQWGCLIAFVPERVTSSFNFKFKIKTDKVLYFSEPFIFTNAAVKHEY
jgi:hypothetical protein